MAEENIGGEEGIIEERRKNSNFLETKKRHTLTIF